MQKSDFRQQSTIKHKKMLQKIANIFAYSIAMHYFCGTIRKKY